MIADKATLPPAPPAPTERPSRRLLGRKVAVNAASAVAGVIAAAVAYAALAMVIGMGLVAGVMYQAELVRLATGIQPASADVVPAVGSGSSILLAVITLSVPAGALACGLAAYRSTKQWLAARFAMEG